MNTEILKYVLLICFTVFGIFTNSLSFNPLRFKCENYILNSYLYFILSWAIVLTTIATLSSKNISLHELFSGPFTILLMVSSMLLLIGLLFIPPERIYTKHLLYVFQIILLGIFLYPLYVRNLSLFNHVGLTTLIILLGLSAIAYFKRDLIKESWGGYLLAGIIVLLLARIVEMFITYRDKKRPNNYSRTLSYISIALFAIFILYDTKQLMINRQNCVRPDYINESLNLFLDSLNMFTNIYHIRDT